MRRVMKFGGALMSDAEGIIKVGQLVKEYSSDPLVIVVSAIGKITNSLEKLHTNSGNRDKSEKLFLDIKDYHLNLLDNLFPEGNDELIRAIDVRFNSLLESTNETYENRYEAYDSIVSIGEELSSCIIYHYLLSMGISARLINAKSLITTNSNYTDADVDWNYTQKTIETRINPMLETLDVVVTQGFIGSDISGKPTTLGREGSDFTAAIFGNILNADEVTIWKNVPGLMNSDPARFDDSEKIENISYHEAIELAYYGASVIHPKTIQPLKQKNIPLLVRPYYDSSLKPTIINNNTSNDSNTASIIVKDDQVLMSIGTQNLSFIAEDNLKQIFSAFSRNRIHINMMQNSAVSFSVSFNKDNDKLKALIDDLSMFNLKYNTGLQLLTIRHYTDELINKYVTNKKVYLLQKSRVTVQILLSK
ncbi:MAG: aspartate kinase [Lentimicrobiaceae bacterium]|nr:aspartate kinase [Lentimicrobiaceae bacterium]MBT3454960.1 aspartate kinase [Lentimicrobiaceae bacterium]MBT3818414.1 aspartate kinase [Lentimicrobiaceae bacterium]MBT4060782.1 aspartate kinase [Lentimicrobiaceae bacterium]MBT4190455.1 aspartate kinase [Lentimicrobiaceae bacterium]